VIRCAALAIVLALPLAACGVGNAYFLVGTREQTRELRELFRLLAREKQSGPERFVLTQQIAQVLSASGDREKEILFLTSCVEKYKDDPYNAYFLLMVAEAYREMKAEPLALHYYTRILKNHTDLRVGASSIHFHCLQEMVALEKDPELRIEYYKNLISRFEDQLESPGAAYYELARSYEQVGDWEQAIQVYRKFLRIPDTEIPGVPNAYRKVQDKVSFSDSADKSWTVEDLPTLIAAVKDAILSKNIPKLLRYQAKANFFQMPRSGEEQTILSAEDLSGDFSIVDFLRTSHPWVDDEPVVNLEAGTAELRTTNWMFKVGTWYLYFRKVDFIADPQVNGRWEWVGIYFGDRM
jgi:tetratricopeptide (TPR) repeat protein